MRGEIQMSYAFNNPCWTCAKRESCLDASKVREAVNEIHKLSYEEGHQGSGEILLSCNKMNSTIA